MFSILGSQEIKVILRITRSYGSILGSTERRSLPPKSYRKNEEGSPEAVRKHAEGTHTFDQGAVEVTGQAERVKLESINRSCIQVGLIVA